MSIRLWLMVADCWSCGTSIELSEEQEREARRLLNERPAPAAPAPAVERPSTPPPRQVPLPAAKPAPPRPAATVTSHVSKLVRRVAWNWRQLWRELPSWLASLVLHMVALILLSLWILSPEADERPLILATQVNSLDLEGGLPEEEDDPEPTPLVNAGEAEALPIPEADFSDSMNDLASELGNLPDSESLNSPLTEAGPGAPGSMFSGRSPEARASLVETEGGTIETEAAVARGLQWLARHQHEDGRWSLNAFRQVDECRGRCTGPGTDSDTAATALALLPFLGAGQTHLEGSYRDEVRRGLYWLMSDQNEQGTFQHLSGGRMYAHGQAAIALCEAYALTRDPELKPHAQEAVDYIVSAQHQRGGWRYAPRMAGDVSVVGWQIMALRSAQMGYLDVPQETLDLAGRFLDSAAADSSGGLYGYMPGSGASHAMTAEGLLCRQYLGWPRDHKGLMAGQEFLLNAIPGPRRENLYYWYYATQVMHHLGERGWQKWNEAMIDTLLPMQERNGHEAGSWYFRAGHDAQGGRVYSTALSVCILEVYYRHMPLYRQSAVDD